MGKWVGHGEVWPIVPLILILPRKGLDSRHLGDWSMRPYAFSYLHNWAPAGVDTANMLLLPFAEEQSGQTQGGCNKGPATVTSLSNKGSKPVPGGGKHQVAWTMWSKDMGAG